MFIYFILTYLLCSIFAAEIFGPMFKDMGLTSIYEYLERRFGKTSKMNGKIIRGLMTLEFIAQNIFYVGIVIYSPATALEVVTGLNKWLCVWLIGGICIFYTSIGGLKAVVWTDTFQICIMLSGYVAIVSKASVDFGSFKNISEPYKMSENWVYDEFSWDPRIRHSFWTVIIGGLFGTWGNSFCCSQSMVQRSLAVKNKKNVSFVFHVMKIIYKLRISIYLAWILISAIVVTAMLVGMSMFRYNACCDPYTAGWVETTDQLVPYLSVIIFKSTPGVAGLYVSGAFSGTLSTVSSGINSMTTVSITDFIQPRLPHKSDVFFTRLSKLLTVVFGICCIGFAYIAANLGGVLQAALSVNGMMGTLI